MNAWKTRQNREYWNILLLFRKSLVSNCFQVILTFAHKLGKNTNSSDSSLYLSEKLTWWVKGWNSLLTRKRSFIFATNVLEFKILIQKEKWYMPIMWKVQCSCDFQTANTRMYERSSGAWNRSELSLYILIRYGKGATPPFPDIVFWACFGERLIPKPSSSLLEDSTFPEMVASPNFLHVLFNVLTFDFEQCSRH